jgi:hypothetical protein
MIKEHPNGPNLALNINDLGTHLELRCNQTLITIAIIQIKCGSELAPDLAHGRQVTDFEDAIFISYELRVELGKNDVLFVELG